MKQDLPITYNHTAPIGVVSDDPVMFLQYGEFLDDFKIISNVKQRWLTDLPLQNTHVTSLDIPIQAGRGLDRLIRSKKFVDMVKDDPKRKYVMYSPLDPPYKTNPLVHLMNSPTIAHAYENKRYFRDEFASAIHMPEYEIKYMNELDRAASYRTLRDQYGSFVLQDEESSGSKGTYVVHNEDEYLEAVKALKQHSQSPAIVVSQFVKGENCSIQVCITKNGIFSAGLQRQLVDSKYLCNPKLRDASKWCGGEIGADYPDIVQHQAQEMAIIVGTELASHGYKGIFGIDLLVTPETEVYAIEINARLTGYSHMISGLQYAEGKIPFMLLHLLELGNYRYEVTDWDALPSSARHERPLSYLIYNNPLNEEFVLKHYIRPGLYRYRKGELVFVEPAYSVGSLRGEDTMLIFCKYNENDVIGRGKRIFKIVKYGKSMAKTDLNLKTRQLVETIKQTFELP